MCNDSDMEFWADSESSDPESEGSSTDQELTEDVSSIQIQFFFRLCEGIPVMKQHSHNL